MKIFTKLYFIFLCVVLFPFVVNAECDFYLHQTLEFVDGNVKGCIKKEDINKLLTKKVEIGSSDNHEYKFLSKGDQRINVENCNEYITGIDKGYSPYSTGDMNIESYFIKTCGALVGLKNSVKPKVNNININKYPILEKFPAVLLPAVAGGEGDALESASKAGKSIQDYRKNIKATYIKDYKTLNIKDDDMDIDFQLIAISDFNKDGYADMLVFSAMGSIRGTLRGYKYYLITERNKKYKLYDILSEYDGCMNENSKYTCSSKYKWSPFKKGN
jgi:hypothetical protein